MLGPDDDLRQTHTGRPRHGPQNGFGHIFGRAEVAGEGGLGSFEDFVGEPFAFGDLDDGGVGTGHPHQSLEDGTLEVAELGYRTVMVTGA